MHLMEEITEDQREKDFQELCEIQENRKPILCVRCSQNIPIKEALAQLKAGVQHHCSQYCFEAANGNLNMSDLTKLKKQ